MKKKAKFDIASGIILRGSSIVLSAGVQAWSARMLGPEKIGESAIAMAVAILLCNTVDLGLNANYIRLYLREENAAKRTRLVQDIAALRVVFLSVVAIIAFIICVLVIPSKIFELPIIGAALYLIGSSNQSTWVLVAEKKFNIVYFSTFIRAAISIILCFAFIRKDSPVGLDNIILGISAIIAFAIEWKFTKVPFFGLRKFSERIMRSIPFVTAGKWMILTIGVTTLYSQMEVPLIGYLLSVEDAGIYKAALSVSSAAGAFIVLAHTFVYPTLIESNSKGKSQLAKTVNHIAAKFAAGGIVSWLVLAPCAYYMLPMIFGSQYKAAAGICIILLLGKAILLNSGVFVWALRAKDKDKWVLFLAVLACVVSLTTYYFAAIRYGVAGAAFAYMAAETAILIAAIFVWKFKY